MNHSRAAPVAALQAHPVMNGVSSMGGFHGSTVPLAAPEARPLATVIRRALLGKCPKCGKGALYRAYLKQVDSCAVCGESYRHIRAEDGPPWLTILLTGHIIVPL